MFCDFFLNILTWIVFFFRSEALIDVLVHFFNVITSTPSFQLCLFFLNGGEENAKFQLIFFGIFELNMDLSNEKKRGCIWYIEDSTAQLYGDIIRIHTNPPSKQPVL